MADIHTCSQIVRTSEDSVRFCLEVKDHGGKHWTIYQGKRMEYDTPAKDGDG